VPTKYFKLALKNIQIPELNEYGVYTSVFTAPILQLLTII
jgi:hypothetical protein